MSEMTGGEIIDVVRAVLGECPAYVAQTGGGTATVLVGVARLPHGYNPDDGERYWLAVGPGAYDWAAPAASTFWLGDGATVAGPDDCGEMCDTDPRWSYREVTDPAALADALRHFRSLPDWRDPLPEEAAP